MARLLLGNYLYFPALAWRTDALRQHRFDPGLEVALDFDLLIRTLLAGGCVAYASGEPVFSYRRHATSVSQTRMLGTNVRYAEEREVHRRAVAAAGRRGWRRSVIAGVLQPTSRLNFVFMKVNPPRLDVPEGEASPGISTATQG